MAKSRWLGPQSVNHVFALTLTVELAAKKSPRQHEPSCGLVVVLSGGHRIEVHPDFDTNTFERLVSALEREVFGSMPQCRIALETGMTLPG
jgi:hypothetical protein